MNLDILALPIPASLLIIEFTRFDIRDGGEDARSKAVGGLAKAVYKVCMSPSSTFVMGEDMQNLVAVVVKRCLAGRHKTLWEESLNNKTNMELTKDEERAGISAQTSVGVVTATTGGHGGELNSPLRVASGHTSAVVVAGPSSQNATAKQGKWSASRGTAVESDSDLESVSSGATVNTAAEEELLTSPKASTSGAVSDSRKGPRKKPSKEGQKALAQYKAAVKIRMRLGTKSPLTPTEQEDLKWAENAILKGREHFSKDERFVTTNPTFANKIEENVAKNFKETKRQRSAEEEKPAAKRPRTTAASIDQPSSSKRIAKVSDVAKRHLIVALIDRSHPNGHMTTDQWKQADEKLLQAIVSRIVNEPDKPSPSFEGAGWFMGVKILKCNDDATLKWLTATVPTLEGLWNGAKLGIVDRDNIPCEPRAKVRVSSTVKPEVALLLLQRQNPEIPTADWKLLHAGKPDAKKERDLIIQINKEAENKLYPRFGKMSWGTGSAYLRLKKRHPKDGNDNTLEAGEVERDLGLESVTEATLALQLKGDEATAIAMMEGGEAAMAAVPAKQASDLYGRKDPADQPPS